MEIMRGDVVVCAAPGDYGKPRPAVVVQSDLFNGTHASVVVCLITSHLEDAPLFRIPIAAGIGMRKRGASSRWLVIRHTTTLACVPLNRSDCTTTAGLGFP